MKLPITAKSLRPSGWLPSSESWWSVRSWRSAASALSAGSVGSVLSAGSAFSVASLASISSAGSILSIASSGSILSIGASGSILSVGSAGAFRNEHGEDSEHAAQMLGTSLAIAALLAALVEARSD